MQSKEFSIHEARFKEIPTLENTLKAILFVGSVFCLVFLADATGKYFDSLTAMSAVPKFFVKWSLLLSIGFVINFLFMALAILIHEAAHKMFAKNRLVNEIAGNLMGFPIFLPFNSYRNAHFVHHRILRDKGNDPEAGFHLEKTTYERLLIGALRNSSVLTRNAKNLFLKKDAPRKERRLALLDLFSRLAATVCWYFFLSKNGLSFTYVLVPFFGMSGLVYSLRGTLDHHGLPAAKKVNGRCILAHEKLCYITHTNRAMELLWSNVNYHTVHHMYPQVSHKHLKEIYLETRKWIEYTETTGYWKSMIRLLPKPYYSDQIAEPTQSLARQGL